MYPHLNIHNSSTRSHPSEDRTRSKNCKCKLVFRTSYQNTCRTNAEYQSDTVGKVALILTHGWTLIDEARRELLVLYNMRCIIFTYTRYLLGIFKIRQVNNSSYTILGCSWASACSVIIPSKCFHNFETHMYKYL